MGNILDAYKISEEEYKQRVMLKEKFKLDKPIRFPESYHPIQFTNDENTDKQIEMCKKMIRCLENKNEDINFTLEEWIDIWKSRKD